VDFDFHRELVPESPLAGQPDRNAVAGTLRPRVGGRLDCDWCSPVRFAPMAE